LISQDQMEEWVHEVEERPHSGAVIVRFVIQRLKALTERNEELLEENIALRSGKRVEEYERRIANLEYQLDLLRRQFGGENPSAAVLNAAVKTISFLIYTPQGQVLRAAVPLESLQSGEVVAQFEASQDLAAGGPARLLVTHEHEELVYVFDSGRVAAVPVDRVAASPASALDWKNASQADPRAGEQLAAVFATGKMGLYDYVLQTSRRGCVKRMIRSSFEQHLSKSFIGAGIKQPPDKTVSLTLAGKEDYFVIATREGFMLVQEVNNLSYTIEESLKLSATDYLVSSFVVGQKPSLLMVTSSGKTIHRETGWLEPAASNKSRGQAVFSAQRREAGTRLAGAAALDENDWAAALHHDGKISVHQAADLFAEGSIATGSEVIEFTAFSI
jgi:DNA gyrase/topoisomerase IV subunit A